MSEYLNQISEKTYEELSNIFKKNGWTYYEGEEVTPKMIKNNITEQFLILMEDPDKNSPTSSGRIALLPTMWGKTMSIDICLEVVTIENIPYLSSEQTITEEQE